MKKPIKDRIEEHYVYGISYHELMRKVFPEDAYPKAWRYGTGGGPPGCAMAFGKALRSSGLHRYPDNRICPGWKRR